MLEAFLSTLGAMAANKKMVASWLILLSMATAQLGEKVYIERTAELAVVEQQLSTIQSTLDKMDKTLDKNADKLLQILEEQARVRAELEILKKRAR